jgi:hypothetical protein
MSALLTPWSANWDNNSQVKMKTLAALAALSVSVLLLAGCAEPRNDPSATQEPTPEPKVFVSAPLTGITLEQGAPGTETFAAPAVSCKIDNVAAARPQFNLNKADMVFVQMVEGGATRLVGVWHSQPVDSVGPVRSARPMDADTVAPIGGIFCFSGGQAPFVKAVTQTGVYMASETSEKAADKGSFSRSSAKPAPHNVLVDMALLQSQHLDRSAPGKVFDFVSFNQDSETYAPASATNGLPTLNVTIKYPGAVSYWEGDGLGNMIRKQDRKPHLDATTNEQVKAKNVVVLKVKIDTSFRDARYGYIPRTVLIDSGSAWVFIDGKRISGTWSKTSQAGPIVLTDDEGAPIKLAPGTTWIELMPTNGSIKIKSPKPPEPTPTETPSQ